MNGGICVDGLNGYRCNCPIAFGGTNCGRLQDQCSGIDCLNGGQCIRNVTSVMCLCARGYHGTNCELLIDACRSQPVSHMPDVHVQSLCFSALFLLSV